MKNVLFMLASALMLVVASCETAVDTPTELSVDLERIKTTSSGETVRLSITAPSVTRAAVKYNGLEEGWI